LALVIHKMIQELANGTASARDLNRDLSRFSNPPPIGDRLGGEKFKDRDAGAASCQLLNDFVYTPKISKTRVCFNRNSFFTILIKI
jgi:hypothetical protein